MHGSQTSFTYFSPPYLKDTLLPTVALKLLEVNFKVQSQPNGRNYILKALLKALMHVLYWQTITSAEDSLNKLLDFNLMQSSQYDN